MIQLDGAATLTGPGDVPDQQKTPPPRSPWSYAGLGVEMVVPIVLGLLLGRWLDGLWGTGPWLLLAGVLLGIAAGFYNFFRVVLGPRA